MRRARRRSATPRAITAKRAERLLKAVEGVERMARGRLCVLSRTKDGGKFYHLQYRKDTKLHQRYVSRDEAPAYERATESYRKFMELVDAFVDEMSAKCAKEIGKEAKDARRKAKAAERAHR